MKVIIVGCGRLGTELAYRLFKRKHEVVVVDIVETAFMNLPSDFNGRTIVGNILHKDVLIRAGIEEADAVAAVSDSDEMNLIVGRIARDIYKVRNVIARNFSPNNRRLFEIFGLQVVSSTSWGAQRVEELMYHSEIRTVFSAGNGEVEVYEVTVPQEWQGRLLDDLVPCDECSIVALTRAGKAVIPSRDAVLQSGDLVSVAATFEGIENLRQRIELPARGEV